MKRKYADYPTWTRVKEKEFVNKYVEENDFKGYVSLLTAIEVKEKLVVGDDQEKLVILDDNFKWLELYPDNNKNIALSVALNDKNEIIEWYFDIAKSSGLTEKGIPYIDDLYLDVVMSPLGKIKILDEDELKEALENKIITQEDFDLAYNVADNLIKQIDGKHEKLKEFSNKYFKLFL